MSYYARRSPGNRSTTAIDATITTEAKEDTFTVTIPLPFCCKSHLVSSTPSIYQSGDSITLVHTYDVPFIGKGCSKWGKDPCAKFKFTVPAHYGRRSVREKWIDAGGRRALVIVFKTEKSVGFLDRIRRMWP